MITNIYFLGYSRKKTSLISFLKKKKNIKLVNLQNRKLSLENAIKADLIICFGYRKIIGEKIFKVIKRPIINLHISYLPYNRGVYPNYWSFVNKTPKGVAIQEMNYKIDKGRIILRKKIKFGNFKKLTFENTYENLIYEIEKLFIKNFKKILNKNYKSFYPKNKGSYNSYNDFPKSFKRKWKTNIYNYLKEL